VHRAESTEKTIEFKLGLRVTGLAFIPSDGAEARRAAPSIGAVLHEYPAYAMIRRVD